MSGTSLGARDMAMRDISYSHGSQPSLEQVSVLATQICGLVSSASPGRRTSRLLPMLTT
jgi:hypothetical protein